MAIERSTKDIIKKAFIISILILVAVIVVEKFTQPETPSKPIDNINIPQEAEIDLNSERNNP
jgi:hypothetical protein